MSPRWTTLVQPDALAGAMRADGVVVVDCRFSLADPAAGEAAYRDSHLPGARHAHLDRDLSDHRKRGAGRHPWPDAADFTSKLGAWGISPQAQVVACDDGDGAVRCMSNAIRNAGLNRDQVDYINAHGTSTPLGDVAETVAVKRCFGEHAARIAVSSTKSMTGHLLGAAGGVEAVFSALAVRDQVAPPTINLFNQDPQCDLDYVPNVARPMKIDVAVSNSFGFGGTNALTIVEEAPRAFLPIEETTSDADRPQQVLSLSAFSEPTLKRLAGAYADRLSRGDLELADVCYTANVRRATLPFRLAVAALEGAESHGVVGTAGGECVEFLEPVELPVAQPEPADAQADLLQSCEHDDGLGGSALRRRRGVVHLVRHPGAELAERRHLLLQDELVLDGGDALE